MRLSAANSFWAVREQCQLMLLPTAGILTSKYELVLQPPINELNKHFPKLAQRFGFRIHLDGHWNSEYRFWEYGLMVSPSYPAGNIGLFQVKRHPEGDPDGDLLLMSTVGLILWALDHPNDQVGLWIPQGFPLTTITDTMISVPDNVVLWGVPNVQVNHG